MAEFSRHCRQTRTQLHSLHIYKLIRGNEEVESIPGQCGRACRQLAAAVFGLELWEPLCRPSIRMLGLSGSLEGSWLLLYYWTNSTAQPDQLQTLGLYYYLEGGEPH
jgi:hypothetical protein